MFQLVVVALNAILVMVTVYFVGSAVSNPNASHASPAWSAAADAQTGNVEASWSTGGNVRQVQFEE